MSAATWWTEVGKSSIVLIVYVTELNELLEAGIASWPYGEPRVEFPRGVIVSTTWSPAEQGSGHVYSLCEKM